MGTVNPPPSSIFKEKERNHSDKIERCLSDPVDMGGLGGTAVQRHGHERGDPSSVLPPTHNLKGLVRALRRGLVHGMRSAQPQARGVQAGIRSDV